MTEFRSKGRGKDRKVYPVGKRKAYGVPRELAYEEVQELRKKGDKARLIETNRRKELYAAYEGVTPDNSAAVQRTAPMQTIKKRPEETIELRDEGERPYIAEITGPDKDYHYKRKFIQQLKTHAGGSRKHPIYEVYFKGKLPYGAIVETRDAAYMVVPKSPRYRRGLKEIGTEGMDNRLAMNQLFAARKKAGYNENLPGLISPRLLKNKDPR